MKQYQIYSGEATLTDKRADKDIILDYEGNDISDRNQQFCKLTGLYWICKHAKEDVIGLAHYRRHFIITVDWLAKMEAYCIDVILPVSLYVSPSIKKLSIQT